MAQWWRCRDMRKLLPRAAEIAATFMIGDGVLGLLQTNRHVDLWKDDAMGAEHMVKPFVDRPGRRRAYAVVQIAAGLALAATQRIKEPRS